MVPDAPVAPAFTSIVETKKPSHSSIDDVIAVYKKDVDRTLLRANLRLSVTQRLQRFAMLAQQLVEIHEAGRQHRGEA